MSEFVNRSIGSRQHSYPTTPRGGVSPLAVFARNYAAGPAIEGDQPVLTTGTQIAWGTVDSPGTNVQDVPITPRSTGVVRVIGVVTVKNSDTNQHNVQVQIQVNGITFSIPLSEEVTVAPTGGEERSAGTAIPILVELTGLPIGFTFPIQVLVTSFVDNVLTINAMSSTLEVMEVPVATG